VRQLHDALWQPDLAIVVFFCSSRFRTAAMANALNEAFGEALVVGCTTAGEIGPAGYLDHTVSGFSLQRDSFRAVAARIDGIRDFDGTLGEAAAARLVAQLHQEAPAATSGNTFGMLLIDGLSAAEEAVARAVQDSLRTISVFGGSAGDDLELRSTFLFADGAFHTDCAVLVLVSTDLPFRLFNTQHFQSSGVPVVVTAADPCSRTVYELNGVKAADEYARLLGVSLDELDMVRCGSSPVVAVIDGSCYVRSVQKIGDDGSLTFFSAIEEGVVLHVARGSDLVGNLERKLAEVQAEIGPVRLLVAFDCILRSLEIGRGDLKADVERALGACNAVGFSTYGEQFHGVHVNQTLVALAVGEPGEVEP
jgi:hypothetical protein